MQRSDIENNYKWKLEDIIDGNNEWEKLYKQTQKKLHELLSYKGKLDKKASLLEFFAASEQMEDEIMRVYAYAKMRHDEDTTLAEYTAMAGRAESLYVEYSSLTSFVMPELTKIPDATIDEYIKDKDFCHYDYMLTKLKDEKKHILPEREEKILAEVSDIGGGFSDVFEMLDNADLGLGEIEVDGKKEKLSHARYSLFMQSENRETRKKAFEKYYEAYKKLIHAIATTYNYSVKKDWFFAKSRGYESCLQMAMSNEDVDSEVYENLIKSVSKNLDVLHEYTEYKKKVLGVENFYMYDMYVPIISGKNLSLEYEEAYNVVVEALSSLGEDYVEELKRAFKEGWIDVFETEGKRSGAYSFGVRTTHPYVLLNYEKTTHDVFTIAHEMGHAMHSYYSNKEQPAAKADYKIFVAEVASTVNEVLLLKHIIAKTTDVQLKKYLLYYLLEMFRTTMFRQTQFAEFEYICHDKVEKGEPLTHENLSEIYLQLNQKYYGDEVSQDDCIKYEWARIPHFYRAFYVYKYATGIITAVSLAEGILSGDKEKLEKYRRFLSSGGSKSPVDLLKDAGVDLTKKQPFDIAMKVFSNTLKELKSL